MRKYLVLTREVHIQPVVVSAYDEKEAIEIVEEGGGEQLENQLKYSHTQDSDTWTVRLALPEDSNFVLNAIPLYQKTCVQDKNPFLNNSTEILRSAEGSLCFLTAFLQFVPTLPHFHAYKALVDKDLANVRRALILRERKKEATT